VKKFDAILIVNFITNIFYTATYPYIYKVLYTNISEKMIALTTIIACLSIIIFSTIWNKYGDKLYKFFPLFCIGEFVASVCLTLYLLNTYSLKPKVFITYVRVAYFDINDSNFRLTFDDQIYARRHDLDFDIASCDISLLPEGYFLMEVKASQNYPLWFARALSDLKIYPTSFSKYGTEYKLLKLEENKL
jgi:hypothetical protein